MATEAFHEFKKPEAEKGWRINEEEWGKQGQRDLKRYEGTEGKEAYETQRNKYLQSAIDQVLDNKIFLKSLLESYDINSNYCKSRITSEVYDILDSAHKTSDSNNVAPVEGASKESYFLYTKDYQIAAEYPQNIVEKMIDDTLQTKGEEFSENEEPHVLSTKDILQLLLDKK